MIFKQLPPVEQKDSQINLSNFFEQMNFIPHIYPARAKSLLAAHKADNRVVADQSGALIARLFSAGMFTSKLTESYLKTSSAIIQSQGFKIHTKGLLMSEINENKSASNELVILVLGGQVQKSLERRVEKAYEFGPLLPEKRMHYIFSGKNDGNVRPNIPYEASAMYSIFESLARRDRLEYAGRIKCILEEKSATTSQNLYYVINQHLKHIESKVDLIIATSSFHHVRVSKYLKEITSSSPLNQVANIYLVGAEEWNYEFLPHEPDHAKYIKSMVNDLNYWMWNAGLEYIGSFDSEIQRLLEENKINRPLE